MIATTKRTRLLNPGPVTLTERVRQALLRPDLCHREPEFTSLQANVRDRLESVYQDTSSDYTAVLVTGSGTAAVEAMVGTLVPRDGRALVVANGVYGERMAAMLQAHGKSFLSVRSEWIEPMDLQTVSKALDTEGPFTHVIAVHHETTTGRLNDLASLADVCREHDVPLLLDTVSSFGGESIDFAGWNVEACAATANKCLHGVPGIAFALVRTESLRTRPSGASCLYLDLVKNYEAQSQGYPAFTPAVQSLYALQEALCELDEMGGWRARRRHYRRLSSVLRRRLLQAGVRLVLSDSGEYGATLTSFGLPDGVTFDHMWSHLKSEGFVIYPGQQSLKDHIFRLAVMGDLTVEDMEQFCASLVGFLL